jgi:hypothetical protein
MDCGERFQPGGCCVIGSSLAVCAFRSRDERSQLFSRTLAKIVTWRRKASIAGLIIQGVPGFFMAYLYTFGGPYGAGLWLVLLGFVVMMVGTFLN